MATQPDVAFARHPRLGIVAAVGDNRPGAETTLLAHGFHYQTAWDIWTLPASLTHPEAVHRTARTITALHADGHTVAADPRLVRPTDHLASSPLVAQVSRAREPSDIADLIDSVVDGHNGAIHELALFLDATQNWCEHHLGPEDADIAARFQRLSADLSQLSEALAWAGADLLDHTHQPPTAVARHARSHAATATSPARATSPRTAPATPSAAQATSTPAPTSAPSRRPR